MIMSVPDFLLCVCVCVCVTEREKRSGREKEREKERENEMGEGKGRKAREVGEHLYKICFFFPTAKMLGRIFT